MSTISNGTDERGLFEAWYCEDAARQGCALPDGIASLREGDHYGTHRHMLNGKWQGWQAGRAFLSAAQAPALPYTLTAWCCEKGQGEGVAVCQECAEVSAAHSADASPEATAGAAQAPTFIELHEEAASRLADLIDIYDDEQKNAPEDRCYVPEAWRDVLAEARKVVANVEKKKMLSVLRSQPSQQGKAEHHGLDDDTRVCFYEQDFYVLSNFSSFTLDWRNFRFDTSEAAYHYEKFVGGAPCCNVIAQRIRVAPSAHEAFKIAEANREHRRPDWDDVKVGIMRDILRAKADQHEYVRRKLLDTGDRLLVENSWRDDYWGWGPNRDGKNMLGKLWMEIRAEIRAADTEAPGGLS